MILECTSMARIQQNSDKNELYTFWCVYKQCQKHCRNFEQISFRIFHPYMIEKTLSVNCISFKENDSRSCIREKNVYFNIDSGHFEFMSTLKHGDYQPHFITLKLDFLKYLLHKLQRHANQFDMSTENEIFKMKC